jgi:1-acyl-sn-glycerol-3-phosphate acyltransferase
MSDLEDLIDPEELEELRQAVSSLRSEIEERFGGNRPEPSGFVETLSERAEAFDPIALFQLLRSRYSWSPRRQRAPAVDSFGLDPEALERARPLLNYLFERWWRVRVSGEANLPTAGSTIFVANRSGVFPYDGLMLSHAVEKFCGPEHRPRFLVADWLVGLAFAQPLLSRLGGVRACAENAERILDEENWLIAFPEGQKGALKHFHDRYRLQRFARGGFVSIAIRKKARIIPVSIIGAEEVHPILLESKFLSQLLGFPALVTPTFPLLGPLGLLPLPSRWRIRFGQPVEFSDTDLEAADDPLYLNRINEQIRSTIQRMLQSEIRERSSIF